MFVLSLVEILNSKMTMHMVLATNGFVLMVFSNLFLNPVQILKHQGCKNECTRLDQRSICSVPFF